MTTDSISKSNTAIICLSPYSGGMEMDAIKLARLLCDDLNVWLVAKSGRYIANYYSEHMQEDNILLQTIEFKSAFSLSIIRKARKLVVAHDIKNIIFFGASELRSLYFAFLGQNLNIIVRHGTTKTRPKKDWLHQLIYSCVNYHVAICEHLAENVRCIIPLGKNSQLKIIYPSLRQLPKINEKTGKSISKDKVVRLLHVGRIADGKGQKEAVEACEILYKQNIPFELICVGEIDPGYHSLFNSFVASKPFAASVQLVGYTDDVGNYYRQAHIFIFPSKGEGLSNSFIEALSYGLICICYNNTSFPELQQLGFSFYMAKDKNLDDLKANLLEAVTQAKSAEIPLAAQSEKAQILFSAERERNEYLDILQ